MSNPNSLTSAPPGVAAPHAAPAPPSPTPPAEAEEAQPTGVRMFLKDIPASLVTFLVAVPLSMGIALASGAPIMAGLISAAIGGIVVGALAGVPLQVSGPAAGLAVIVFNYIHQFGLRTVAAITLGAGVLQIAFGAARVARTVMAISPAVIHGMLAGIGIQIALAQLHVVLGGSPESSALRNVMELPGQVRELHGTATLLGLLTIALVLLWPLVPVKKLRLLPAALVAIVTATVIATLVHSDAPRVSVPHDWRSAFALPAMPQGDKIGAAVLAALTLAIVASAESLLSAVATDKLHRGPRANLDRELIAQGVGNSLAGLIGGLPITGVIVRSTANISAGARTRLSTMLHGAWVVLFVTQLGFLLNRIPLAALAGLLVVVGVKLVNLEHIRELRKHKQLSIYLVTLAGVVGINLLAGIALGIGLAIVLLLRRLTHVTIRTESREREVYVLIKGTLTFVGVPKLSAALAALPAGRHIAVDLEVDLVDHAAFEALHSWRSIYEKTGGTVDMDLLHEFWSSRASSNAPLATAAALARHAAHRDHSSDAERAPAAE